MVAQPSDHQPWRSRPRNLASLGFAGSLAILASSYWVAAVPTYFRTGTFPIVSLIHIGAFRPRLVFYFGLSALCLAWLQLGRLIMKSTPGLDWVVVRRIALLWTVPFLFAIPLESRDLWAYAAQSQLVLHHLDPYSVGPSALPGAFSVEVSHRWVDTPAPYGPLWLLMGKMIAAAVGVHVGLTVAVLRLLSVGGLILLAYSVPALARRAGGRPDLAMWLVCANPFTLILGVGGGHNDLLMAGLMTMGLAVVTGGGSVFRSLILGTVILTAAVAIKSPAAVALLFAVPLWLRCAPAGSNSRTVRAACRVSAAAMFTSVGVFAGITLLSGLGLGWIKQVNSSASVVSWMSLPSATAIVWDLVTLRLHRILKFDPQMAQFRTVGTVISIALLIALWLLAMRAIIPSSQRRRALPTVVARADAWTLLAIALTTVVVLGPTVQVWYFGWALAIAGTLALRPRLTAIFAGLSIAAVVMIRPNGVGLQMNPAVIPIIAGAVAIAMKLLPDFQAERAAKEPVGTS